MRNVCTGSLFHCEQCFTVFLLVQVLAGPEPRVCAVEHLRYWLGQVRLEQRVRPLDTGSLRVRASHATLQSHHCFRGNTAHRNMHTACSERNILLAF